MIGKVLPMLRILLITIKQSVLARPIPVLTGPCTAELGLPSIHSYGYASQSSPAFIGACSAPPVGNPVRNAGYTKIAA